MLVPLRIFGFGVVVCCVVVINFVVVVVGKVLVLSVVVVVVVVDVVLADKLVALVVTTVVVVVCVDGIVVEVEAMCKICPNFTKGVPRSLVYFYLIYHVSFIYTEYKQTKHGRKNIL
jgi:hypothetical protein